MICFTFLLSILLTLLTSTSALAETATLSWTPPTTNADGTPLIDLAGYKVYFGTTSGRYTQVIDVGLTTTPSSPEYVMNNLTDGYTYYFAVTAYDTSRYESGFSNQANKAIPFPDGTFIQQKLINISTRGFVGTGDNAEIGGFILGGNLPKLLLLRGFGPTLSSFGVSGTLLANPIIQLFYDDDNNPSTPAVLVASNDDWGTPVTLCGPPALSCGTPADILATGMSADSYASTNPNRALDAAILVTLPPGAYTISLRGVNNGTGIGLVGVDDPDATTLPKLVNISTRGLVLTGSSNVIGGFIIGAGTGNKTVLIRGFGPTLSDFGISGALSNPTVELAYDHDNNPSTSAVVLATNDDWGTPITLCNAPAICGTPQDILNTGRSADSYAPTNPNRGLDSAILVTLPPGAYVVRVRGVNNVTGVGLVGVNEIGQ